MSEQNTYEPAALADIEAARERIAETVVRTPLVRLEIDAPAEIFLKLETLQPIGSFKVRGARAGGGKLVCVVSGGNIDTATLEAIIAGKMP